MSTTVSGFLVGGKGKGSFSASFGKKVKTCMQELFSVKFSHLFYLSSKNFMIDF